MKFKYNILAFLFIGIFGTIGHFLYEFTDNNQIIGFFFPVNESTWEHLKLIFFPTIIYSLVEYNFVKDEIKNYAPAITISTMAGMLGIIIIFYTYIGILGFNVDFINITTYFIGLIIMLIVKNKIIENEKFLKQPFLILSLLLIFVIALLFVIFTYNPPKIALFVSPV